MAAGQQPPTLPPLPLTALDQQGSAADLDNHTFSLTFAQPVPITDLLLLLVRGTTLSIVPSPDTSGSFIGELKQVTVRQALALILPPLGLGYSVDGPVIRVFRQRADSRIYNLNYVVTSRTGSSTVTGPAGNSRSSAAVASSTRADFFDEIRSGVEKQLSPEGTFNIDRKAGLLEVNDFPDRLDRVAQYLDAVHERVHRQAQIDARVIEIELTDDSSAGVDWTAIAGDLAAPPTPAADRSPVRPSLTGLRVTDLARLMTLLAAQGRVSTLSNQRLITLNNEPAILRTETSTFSVTPQIGEDAVVMLSLTPLIRTPALVESDMIARVADGETLVLWGFTRNREFLERAWFGRTKVVARKRVEMVVLLTPKVVTGVTPQ